MVLYAIRIDTEISHCLLLLDAARSISVKRMLMSDFGQFVDTAISGPRRQAADGSHNPRARYTSNSAFCLNSGENSPGLSVGTYIL